jgi:hypothetical protein
VRWSVIWAVALSILVLLLAFWEMFWRLNGFIPSITDDWPVWGSIRREVNADRAGTALVGASRVLVGVNPDAFVDMARGRAYMLAIDGSNPLPVLENLAADPGFRGRVICSIPPFWLAGSTLSRGDRAEKWLRKYENQSFASKIETRLTLSLQASLVFRYSGLAPANIWEKWRKREKLRPPYAPMRIDRYRPADYSKTDLEALRMARVNRTRQMHQETSPLDRNEFAARVQGIQEAVRRIHLRGGKVAFVRMPSCGQVKEIEEQTMPRHTYWDFFAGQVTAHTIHFEDYLELNRSKCTDGSHLNYDDAHYFSGQLLAILSEKGFFQ